MFFNTHTHNHISSKHPEVVNLTFDEAEKIFNSNQQGIYSLGFHPWFLNEFSVAKLSKLEEWIIDSRFFAIGECGLDKNSNASFDSQIKNFKLQIELAEKFKKPTIIHCVGYFNELLDLKKKLNPEQLWIIHGFRGKSELAIQILKSGCSISFGNNYNPESVRVTPFDKLFIETDESNITIENVYSKIAKEKNCVYEELVAGENLFHSYLNQFRL